MTGPGVERVTAAVRRRMGLAVAVSYAVAALLPGPGMELRQARRLPAGVSLHPTLILLALMLFTASLQVPIADAGQMLRRPRALLAGLAVRLAAPLLILPVVIVALRALPDRDHGAVLLAGLILVTAMPVASGATVWVGKGHGDQPTMVALVVASTLISPVTVPLTVAALAALLDDTVADVLEGGTSGGANSFTLLTVVLPCAAGIAARLLLPGAGTALLSRICGPSALFGSLLLTYSNASGAVGSFHRHPDVPLMVFAAGLATAVCLVSFALGRCAARGLRLHAPAAASVTLACGMSNSSAGAVLVSTLMPTRPHALLPVLAYSLVQQVAANRFTGRRRAPSQRSAVSDR